MRSSVLNLEKVGYRKVHFYWKKTSEGLDFRCTPRKPGPHGPLTEGRWCLLLATSSVWADIVSPKKECWSPNPWYLWSWPDLEIGYLQMSKGRPSCHVDGVPTRIGQFGHRHQPGENKVRDWRDAAASKAKNAMEADHGWKGQMEQIPQK